MAAMRQRLLVSVALFGGICALKAETIVSVTGPINSSIELFSTEVLDVSWIQSGEYTDVAISAFLNGSTPITAYLTTQVGPGATTSQEIASAVVTPLGAPFSLLPLFSIPDLAPGTYFLTLFDASPESMTDGWAQTTSAILSTAPDATLSGYYDSITASGYPPANMFVFFPQETQQALMFEVTGTAVPEPWEASFISLAILGIWALRKRCS